MSRKYYQLKVYMRYYTLNLLHRPDTLFCLVLLLILLSFPIRAIYILNEVSGHYVHLTDAWILMLNNTWLHFYLTALYLFLISQMPFQYDSIINLAIRTERSISYYAPVVFAALIAVVLLICTAIFSFIASIPISYYENEWSIPMRLLENTQIRVNYNISFAPPYLVMRNTNPWSAFMLSFVQLLLLWVAFAQILFFWCAFGKKKWGYITDIAFLLVGWIFMIYGDNDILLLVSPFHHSYMGYAFWPTRPDLSPIGIVLYMMVINLFMLSINVSRKKYGQEILLNESYAG